LVASSHGDHAESIANIAFDNRGAAAGLEDIGYDGIKGNIRDCRILGGNEIIHGFTFGVREVMDATPSAITLRHYAQWRDYTGVLRHSLYDKAGLKVGCRFTIEYLVVR
jgi:hypothetical protein